MLTKEFDPVRGWYTEDAAFRRYDDPMASSADWWRLMQTPRYANVYGAADLDSAYSALGSSGYATDPRYVQKLQGLMPATPQQQAFLQQRQRELIKAGAPEHLAELGARQSALETGWGRSAPNNNFYGIKAPQQLAQAGRPDVQQGLFAEVLPMAGQQAPQPMAQAQPQGFPQPQPPGFWDRLTGNPAFNMGLGILASNTGNYGAWGPAIGRGAMLGLQNVGAMQEGQTQAQMQQMQMELARRKWQKDLDDARYVEEWVSTLPPEEQRLAKIIGPDKFAQFKLEQSKTKEPSKRYEYTKGGVLDTFTGDFKERNEEVGAPNTYKIDDDLKDVWRLDPEKAVTIQEARNKDRQAGISDQTTLRKEYVQAQSEFGQIERAAKVLPELVNASKTRNSKVSDLALVVQLAKAMDPTSVVREGEVYTIQRQGGLFDALASYLGYVQNKGQLTEQMRQDLAETVMAYYRTAYGSAEEKQKWYGDIAKRYKVDPFTIVGNPLKMLPPISTPPPPPGFTERVR